MKKKSPVGMILAAILVIAAAVILAVTYFVLKNNVILGLRVYPRHQAVLDLREEELSIADYGKLAMQMPDSEIRWSVPVGDMRVPDDTSEITVSDVSSLTEEVLTCLPKLKTVHAGACEDYPALAELYRAHPELDVQYTVELAGDSYPSDAECISVTSLTDEDAQLLQYLPDLAEIDAMNCPDFAAVSKMAEQNPQWEVKYLTSIGGAPIDLEAVSLEMTGVTADELSYALVIMPELEQVLVHDPDAPGSELQAMRDAHPDVALDWDVTIEGKVFSGDSEELDLSYFRLTDVETAKNAADKFPNLKKLIVDSGNIDNETMAAFREEMRPAYKVVWTVTLGTICKARTDEIYFMPIQQGDYYFSEKGAYNLRYCEDMVCIDVGHSVITTIDFVSYMPHLKYLILAWTQVQYIEPISSCKELVYLEVDHTIIRDLTPIKGCTALEDINLNDQMNSPDVSPICEMTWLKNVWAADMGTSKKLMLVESLPDTRVVTAEISSLTGEGWRNLDNYYAMRDLLGMPYMR